MATLGDGGQDWAALAAALDASDPLAASRDLFAPLGPDVVAYLDGNSLGRPLTAALTGLADFAAGQWQGRLIRGWGEGWMDWPTTIGDRIGRAALGAGRGQVVVADSTSVLLYKLARAAVDARGARRTVVIDADNFPTDRYLLEGIAAERGLRLAAIDTDRDAGVTASQVEAVAGDDTALVVLSHVAYRSGWIADVAAITEACHRAGALVLWDLSHSVGAVPIHLDAWGVDLAVGCSYKYLSGGPGAPAFAYVRAEHQGRLRQPIWGWMGHDDPFAMGPGYRPANGVRSLISGTPPITAMVPLLASLDLLERSGIDAVRAKSERLTAFAVAVHDAWLAPLGVTLGSPRQPDRRGGHITIRREDYEAVNRRLWARGVLPDFRHPDGIRLGMAPLSTSFAEVLTAMAAIRDEAASAGQTPHETG